MVNVTRIAQSAANVLPACQITLREFQVRLTGFRLSDLLESNSCGLRQNAEKVGLSQVAKRPAEEGALIRRMDYPGISFKP